jgi:hypothetical protein
LKYEQYTVRKTVCRLFLDLVNVCTIRFSVDLLFYTGSEWAGVRLPTVPLRSSVTGQVPTHGTGPSTGLTKARNKNPFWNRWHLCLIRESARDPKRGSVKRMHSFGSLPFGRLPLGSRPLGVLPVGSLPFGSLAFGRLPFGSRHLGVCHLGV